MRQYARLVAMGMAAVAASATLSASVLDEAKFWWKFDQGGANGAVVQTSEIHDCRDASVGAATRVCGPSGGPIWTNMTVRLPYQQKDVECTALNIQVVPNAAGTQIRPSMVDITNGHVHSDTVTFFARICAGEQLYTGTVDRFLYNNAFRWGSTKGDSYGNLFGIRTNGTRYSPEFFIGQESAYFENIFVDPGKWYDLAFSISVVTNVTTTTVANDTTNVVQRVLCVLLIVGCAAAALYGAHQCMQQNSLKNYGYLKTQAERAYEKGDTVEALNWISLAEPVMPASSPELELMKADILWHTGGKEEAGEVLYRLVERAPVLQVYETLIGYLTEERNYIEAAHVLAASGLKELADMHPELQSATPQMSLSDGGT